MHDVAIVGAGPAGLYAALLLARQGFDVVSLEEHAEPGVPVHCTGVVAADAFTEFGLPDGSVLNPLSVVIFHAPSGARIEHRTERVEAVVIDRVAFDQQLLQLAVGAGVRVASGSRVTGVSVEPDSATIQIEAARQVRARAVILACGASYALARRLGLGLPAVHLQSAQLELPARTLGPVEVHFGSAVAPRGFAWAVPVQRAAGSFVRVGLMCDERAGAHFARFAVSLRDRWGLDIPEGGAPVPRQKILPLAPIPRTFDDRVVAIGDAAGLVKATTGGGIYYSLLSASLAAEVLAPALRGDRLDARTLSAYEERWRAQLGAELRAQRSLRQIADRLDDEQIDAFFELARTDGVMPLVRRTARFNQHRDLILSLFRHEPARQILFRRLASAWRPGRAS